MKKIIFSLFLIANIQTAQALPGAVTMLQMGAFANGIYKTQYLPKNVKNLYQTIIDQRNIRNFKRLSPKERVFSTIVQSSDIMSTIYCLYTLKELKEKFDAYRKSRVA